MCGNDEFDIIGSLEIANTHRDVPAVLLLPNEFPDCSRYRPEKQVITGKTSTNYILVIYMLLAQRNVTMGKFLLRISS